MARNMHHTGGRLILLGCTISILSVILFILTFPPDVSATSDPDNTFSLPASFYAAAGTTVGLGLCLVGLFLRWRAQS